MTSSFKLQQRVVLFPKDVINITGLSERSARRLIQKIKLALGKEPEEFVTITEFSNFTGIEEKLIKEFMRG